MDIRSSVPIRISYSFNVLVDLFGMIFFVALILATLRSKKLHSSCHLLIGLYSICCLLSKSIILLPFFLYSFPSINTLPLFACAIPQLIPICATYNIYSTMLAIAVDRLLSVFLPIWYTMRNDKTYLALVYSISSIYPIYIAFVILKNVWHQPQSQSQCSLFELTGTNVWEINLANILFNLATICCYALMLAKLRFHSAEQAPSVRQPLFKSLTLIMAIQIGGWSTTLLAYNLIASSGSWNLTPEQIYILFYFINCFSSLTSTVEVPALYFTSSDHRAALRKEFRWFFRIFSKQNSVASDGLATAAPANLNPNYLNQLRRISTSQQIN